MFIAGYLLGSRGGAESFDEVVKALRAVRESDEFHDLAKAVRSHTAASLRGLAGMLDRWGTESKDAGVDPSDLLQRVRLLTNRR